VVTLVPEPSGRVFGRLYRVATTVLEHLDVREKAGYTQHRVGVECTDGTSLQDVLLYVAGEGNPSWLGPASPGAMAAQIIDRAGPSGSNLEYVRELARALTASGVRDPDVHDLAAAVAAPPAEVIVLTTCTATKAPDEGLRPARSRYRSPRLDHVGEAAAAAGRPLVILSGALGLVAATEPVGWYDRPLRPDPTEVDALGARLADRLRAWGVRRVIAHLRPRTTPGWAPYHDALDAGCRAADVRLESVPVPAHVAEAPEA